MADEKQADRTWEVAGVKVDLGDPSRDAAVAQLEKLSYTDLRRVYADLTKDKVSRHPDQIKAYLATVVGAAHAAAHCETAPEDHADTLVGLEEEARRSIAPKLVQGRKGSINDVLQGCAEEGVTDPAKVLARVETFLEGAPASHLTIKEVTILNILRGLSTPAVLQAIEAAFRDEPSVEVNSTDKTVAFYRTRLRTDYGIDLPTAPRAARATAPTEVPDAPEEVAGDDGEPEVLDLRDTPLEDEAGASTAGEDAGEGQGESPEVSAAEPPPAEGGDEQDAAELARRPRRSTPDLGTENHVRGAGRARAAAKKDKVQGGRGPK